MVKRSTLSVTAGRWVASGRVENGEMGDTPPVSGGVLRELGV